MLASYHRSGGRRPSDDESLEIDADGSFVLTRTVGGPRVGSFAGTISKHSLAALTKLAEKADDYDDRPTGLPPHVMESVATSRADISVGARAKADVPAMKLVKRMRQLVDDLTANPAAAIELTVAADGRSITMQSVGADPVEVDFGHASITYTLYGAQEELLTAGEIAGPPDAARRTRLASGWSTTLQIEEHLTFNSRRTLDVQVEFDLFRAEGEARRARLRAIAGKDWAR